jgi:hypothetical protein
VEVGFLSRIAAAAAAAAAASGGSSGGRRGRGGWPLYQASALAHAAAGSGGPGRESTAIVPEELGKHGIVIQILDRC